MSNPCWGPRRMLCFINGSKHTKSSLQFVSIWFDVILSLSLSLLSASVFLMCPFLINLHLHIQRFFSLLIICHLSLVCSSFTHVLCLALRVFLKLPGSRASSYRWSQDSNLPDMLDLTDYQPMYQQIGLPRRLGSAGSHEQPSQDMVYR